MPTALTSIDKRRFANALELKLRRSRGDKLQEFLAALMEKVHGDNFTGATHFFSQGDLKCDGLLSDPLTIFACYGPTNGGMGHNPKNIADAVDKVGSDFVGALGHWPELKAWLFVHSYVPACPPAVTQKIMELDAANSGLDVKQFGMDKFRRTIEGLCLEDVEELLGEAASDEDFRDLQLPMIQSLIDGLMETMPSASASDDEPMIVPEKKLVFNDLSQVYQDFVRRGLRNAAEVERYFSDHHVTTFAGDTASLFKTRYLELKTQGFKPDDIMDELFEFILGGKKSTAPRQVAIWNLLAHLFEKCTIFEDHPVEFEIVTQ